jgi:hypothetical protein
MLEQLVDTLTQAGKPPHVVRSPAGAAVLLLPYGGRVLGLFAPQVGENFYWTHPELQTVAAAREFYQSSDWHNSGGERTWLAPELDFFFPDYPNRERYWQPRQLDPGDYRLICDERGARLVNRLKCLLSRTKTTVELEITKSIGPAPNPLRHEFQGDLSGLAYAGYSQETTLQLLACQGDPQVQVGLWNLIQMPHGGDLLVATCGQSYPAVVFGALSPQDLAVGDHLVRYRMRACGEQKISFRAVTVTGRIGYRYQARDGSWSLVIRNVFINPSGQYVDVPWDAPDAFGYAVQACNINSPLGQFSELEYHVPAVSPDPGRRCCADVSQVWAFRGRREQIDAVVHALLTPEQLDDE